MAPTAEDAPETEEEDRSGPPPWTIKSMPWEERSAAAAAAKRAKMHVGKWLALAIRAKIEAEQNAETGLVVTGAPPPSPEPPEIDDVIRLVALSRELAEITGKPPPRDMAQLAYQQIRARLRGGLTR